MKALILAILFTFVFSETFSQAHKVSISNEGNGKKLLVNQKPFMINGVNWDYVPIGNGILDDSIWVKSDSLIKTALNSEMSLLKKMGINAIRTYGLHPKWVEYIYKEFGIYTMINTQFGAYGISINNTWYTQTDYSDQRVGEVLMQEVRELAKTYKDTPGLLLYMIGNENNYHLSWTGAETEEIPIEDISSKKHAARWLYKAFNQAAKEIKAIDSLHPVAICNGDLLYLDLVKEECSDIDIYGTNMYRGISFGDAFERVKKDLDIPILFAEFGADAYNARDEKEDQFSQAFYNLGNWKEIYQNAHGMGGNDNSIGGFTFQFSDGWWKYKQTEDLEIHNTTATWANNGYSRDQSQSGDKNMNEEWFGICAKGPTNEKGMYSLVPRAAYYVLSEVHAFDPYKNGYKSKDLTNHFNEISIEEAISKSSLRELRPSQR